ncbi:MAG TPA: hypothetical protein PLD88_10540, partial [Candidatus Berkiella sp.]|nr:hypothetical protein [Candidatus Berkiella sp.]
MSDHALYQGHITALLLLQQKFGLWALPHFRVLESLIHMQKWPLLFELLEKKHLDINTKYCAAGLYFTLLDMVTHHGEYAMIAMLRKLGAKKISELDMASELMF